MSNDEERIIYIDDISLKTPQEAINQAFRLIPYIVFPEDDQIRHFYERALIQNILQRMGSKNYIIQFQKDYPEFSAEMFQYGDLASMFSSNIESSQKGLTGNLFVKGNIAGYLLTLIIKNETIERACQEYQANPICRHGEEIPAKASTLRNIFSEYISISPLLAGMNVYRQLFDNTLFFDPLSEYTVSPEAPDHLNKLLRITTFFRNKLVNFRHPRKKEWLVEDYKKIWKFCRENDSEFSELRLEPPSCPP